MEENLPGLNVIEKTIKAIKATLQGVISNPEVKNQTELAQYLDNVLKPWLIEASNSLHSSTRQAATTDYATSISLRNLLNRELTY